MTIRGRAGYTPAMRTLRSDNNAGLCDEAMRALHEANDGHHHTGYGDDAYTKEAVSQFREMFGEDCTVFFVATGTAANTLSIAALTEPWQRVIGHAHSHYNEDESTAPERLTHCRFSAIHAPDAKLTPALLESAFGSGRGDVHQVQPGVVTLSNPTEFGTVYTPDELKVICDLAHEHGYRVQVDGARFANAVASLGCDPRALANDAGVDALGFGGTKNGLAFGEAVIFFPQGDGSAYERAVMTFPFHRKGTGHLLSKHRFVSAPFAMTLKSGAWLRHANHANGMARRLGDGLTELGYSPAFPVEANGVFVPLPDGVRDGLIQRGHQFYPFASPKGVMARLMCSYDTREGEIDAFLADCAELSAAATRR